MFLIYRILPLIAILYFIIGCGGGSGSSSTTTTTTTGYVIDAPVVGLTYTCGDKTSTTGSGGIFTCSILPVTFKLGNLDLGTLTANTSDSNVYVQDILNISRNDFNNSNVVKIGMLLQSFDNDGNISTEITLPHDVNFSTNTSLTDLNLTTIKNLLIAQGITPLSEASVIQHLQSFSAKPALSTPTTIIGIEDTPLIPVTFTNSGGYIANCSVTPSLPSGLTINSSDCNITGTPTTEQSATLYTVTATNTIGQHSATISITINPKTPSIVNASDINISSGLAIPSTVFRNSGGTISSCTISPSLPFGLVLADDCTITGTPTSGQNTILYTVTAKNATGTDTATISITISSSLFSATDALKEDQWYIKNTGVAPDTWGRFTNLTAGADMQVTGAWNLGASGEGIIVTVVDNGIDFSHPDLTSQEVIGKSIQILGTAAIGVNDHGTGCAGIIAAKADTDGVVGIAPNAKLISHKILDGYNLTDSSYAQILSDNISQVSNHSYGPADNGKLHTQSSSTYDSIKNLVLNSNGGKGHVLLFAAGNGRAYIPRDYVPSEINSNYTRFDASETVKETKGDYAGLDMSQNHPYVISVSGFDANDKDVNYAEAGPATLVAGTTGDRFSGVQGTSKSTGQIVQGSYTIPNATNLPSPAMATTGRNDISYVSTTTHRDGGTNEDNGFNMGFNGTSAATPSVTGVVALIRSANTNLTWRDVRWILAKTARKIQVGQNISNQATGQPSTGAYAKPIWSTSGNSEFGFFSHYFGYGAADAGEAVKLAKNSDYTLLPALEECTVTVNDTTATIPASGCPSTIEFIQVKFQATAGLKINDTLFTMQHNTNSGKIIELIVPTTCTAGTGQCDIQANTVTKTGTVGFLGDALSSTDIFTFGISNSNQANSGTIVPQEITVYGHTKVP